MLAFGIPALDSTLGGGLSHRALHEVYPAAPIHFGAASGLALSLAVLAGKATLWIQSDFAGRETGFPYGPGLDLFGLGCERLLILRVPRAIDALFAMEEALKCRALGGIVTALTDDGSADLTATRRLSLAARDGSTLGLLLRHCAPLATSAAATRFEVAAAPSRGDGFGGLGITTFLLSLVKNRRGPCGRWTISWDHHDHVFLTAAHSLGLAATAGDRPDRTAFPFARAG
jgi:protein ImuA